MPQGKSILGLGPGDWTAKPTMNGKMNGTATTCQATVLTNGGVMIQKGRIVVCDLLNVASRSTVTAQEGHPDSNLGNFMLPSTTGTSKERLYPAGVLTENVVPGQVCKPQVSGVVRALSADTVANMPVNTLVMVSTAADNSRGCVIPATTGLAVCGRVIEVQATDGSASAPVLCTIIFDGWTMFGKLAP